MQITDLPPWNQCGDNDDRIVVIESAEGKFEFQGVVWRGRVQLDFSDNRFFDTFQDARAAGVAWAKDTGVTELYIIDVRA